MSVQGRPKNTAGPSASKKMRGPRVVCVPSQKTIRFYLLILLNYIISMTKNTFTTLAHLSYDKTTVIKQIYKKKTSLITISYTGIGPIQCILPSPFKIELFFKKDFNIIVSRLHILDI